MPLLTSRDVATSLRLFVFPRCPFSQEGNQSRDSGVFDVHLGQCRHQRGCVTKKTLLMLQNPKSASQEDFSRSLTFSRAIMYPDIRGTHRYTTYSTYPSAHTHVNPPPPRPPHLPLPPLSPPDRCAPPPPLVSPDPGNVALYYYGNGG